MKIRAIAIVSILILGVQTHAAQQPAPQPPAPELVRIVRLKISAGDVATGQSAAEDYKRTTGVDAEYLNAIGWIARGAEIPVHGDGTSLWTLTHAEDFAQGLVGLLGNPRTIGEVFNITGEDVYTWDQIYTIVADAVGVELK